MSTRAPRRGRASAAARLGALAAGLWCAAAAPAAAAPASPRQAEARGITVVAEGSGEEWQLQVAALAARGDQPPGHAVVLATMVRACDTAQVQPMVFRLGALPEIRKQAALLMHRTDPSGGCADAVATVFPKGSAPSLAGITEGSITLGERRFRLLAEHLAYLARMFAVEPPEPDTATTSTLTTRSSPLPEDPAARAAANEAIDLNERAVHLYAAGRLKEARNASEGAVAGAEKVYGPDHEEVGRMLLNLGLIVRKLGDNKAAVVHYRRAIAILERKGPSESLGVLLDNLGRALEDLDDLDGAIAATTRAIDVLSTALAPDHEHVGYALNNLALLQSAKGEHAKAADTCDRAIAILTKALGPNHPDLRPFLDDQRTLRKRAAR